MSDDALKLSIAKIIAPHPSELHDWVEQAQHAPEAAFLRLANKVYPFVHDFLGKLESQGKEIRELKEKLEFQQAAHELLEKSVENYQRDRKNLEELCGSFQDGSEAQVTISQDDALREWKLQVDNGKWYTGKSLWHVIQVAAQDRRHPHTLGEDC